MRIALVCPYHMFKGGGVQEHVKELHYEYTKLGHYVRIITPMPRDYDGEVPDYIITLGQSRSTTAFAGTAWQWSFSVDIDAIDRVFAHEQFDVLHFHEPWIPVWSRQLLSRAQCAIVGTMHARFWDTMTAKTVSTVVTPYTKPMVKNFDMFTAVSEASIEYFKTLTHRPIVIVPNGIYIDKFKKTADFKSPDRSVKTILYVGRLEHRKGLKYLLQAYSMLAERRSDVRLHIAGTGVDEKKLKDFVKEQKIPRVEFLGFISEADKIKALHNADLFCSAATYGEAFGIVLLEAMAAGTPLVAGDNVGYQSTMKDTGALSLVNPKDLVDFSRRLELMTFNEDLRRVWLDWATKYVQQFNFPLIAAKYLDVYEQAIEHYAHAHQA